MEKDSKQKSSAKYAAASLMAAFGLRLAARGISDAAIAVDLLIAEVDEEGKKAARELKKIIEVEFNAIDELKNVYLKQTATLFDVEGNIDQWLDQSLSSILSVDDVAK